MSNAAIQLQHKQAAADGWSESQVKLPPGSCTNVDRQIRHDHIPPLERYLADYMTSCPEGCPVVLTGCMADWPALDRWQDMGYLKAVAGSRTVPVEVGSHYLAAGWGQALMPFSEFLDRHLTAPAAGVPVHYLAQHPLFDQIPELMRDIREPEYCALGTDEEPTVNAWFGPAGTVTPLHTDPKHNLLAQVVGRKYIRLYHPDLSLQLSPYAEGLTTNSSQIDLDDAAQSAAIAGVPFYESTLQAGQMLYIPPKWMHYVKAMSSSFSVSFWWQ